MRLLYVTNQICGSGGLERVLAIKTAYLIEKYGYEIHFITLNQPGKDTFYNFHKNIIQHNLDTRGNVFDYVKKYIKGLRSIVKKISPDCISVCDDGLKGLFVPFYIGKKVPIIYERHVSKTIQLGLSENNNSIIGTIKYKALNFLMHYGGSKYDKFILLTDQNKNEWRLKNLEVISNPLPFKSDEPALLENKRVIAVGRHHYQKGYDMLLSIWKDVLESYPDWELYIFGKQNKDLKLEELAQKKGISENIIFKNPVKDIMSEYNKSSIFVLSSRFEGFGMVLIEAMSHGLPCVSFDCPYGPSDIVEDGQNGYLIPAGDIEDFAKQIKKLISDEQLRKNLGAKAFHSVDRFLPEHIVPRWDQLFKELV